VQIESEVMRDLQRICALCMSKRRCTHDLAGLRRCLSSGGILRYARTSPDRFHAWSTQG